MLAFAITVDILTRVAAASSLSLSFDDRVRLICDLIRRKMMVTKIPAGAKFHRVSQFRSDSQEVDLVMGLPIHLKRLGPPPAECCRVGRANRERQSRLYCCSDPAGALQEVRVTIADNYDPAAGDISVVSTWEVTKAIVLLTLGYSDLAFDAANSSRRPTSDQLKHYAQLDDDSRKVQDWLDLVFTERIEASGCTRSDPYAIQNAIADAAFAVGRDQIQGIMYPSTRHQNMGVDNIVLEPEFAEDRLTLVGADAQRIWHLTESGADYVSIAKLVSWDGGNLLWHHWQRLNDEDAMREPRWESWGPGDGSINVASRPTHN